MNKNKIIESLKRITGKNEIQLGVPENEGFGDYSTNVALQLAGELKNKKTNHQSHRQLAEEIVEKLKKDKSLIKAVEKIEVAGSGFINFWISEEALFENLNKVLKEGERYGTSKVGEGKSVVVEYSSPNIAKSFGIGHLRSTIIGQAIYNLYKSLGYKVIGDNHLGDWGTQFGVLLAQIAKTNNLKLSKAWLSKLITKNLTIDELEKMYVEFHKEAEENPELWDQARGWFKKLETGDKEARYIWKVVKEISLKEFDRIYKLLGVRFDNTYGESFYEDKMAAIIEEVRNKGLSKKSEGAEIVEFSGIPPPMLLKSDGTTTYYTRDLATIKFRIETWNPNKIVYEVGADQKLHFQQVFETAEMLGWLNGTQLVHIAHGLIRFPTGKMSTRKGETVKLEDVLNEAIRRAYEVTKSETINIKQASKLAIKTHTGRLYSENVKSEVEVRKIARQVGIGAVKYFDLMHHPTSDIIFDWEKMFVLEGNSAPYLQYTVARTNSILAKPKAKSSKLSKAWPFRLKAKSIKHSALSFKLNTEEAFLLRSFIHFPEVIEDSAISYSPNLLCNYLFDLAQKFNNFYNTHRILDIKTEELITNHSQSQTSGSENLSVRRRLSQAGGQSPVTRDFRVALTAATGQILKNGLNILGIQTPERM